MHKSITLLSLFMLNLKSFLALLVVTLLLSVEADEPKSPDELMSAVFAQLPQMHDVTLSPDGSHIAYLFPLDGRNHIILQPTLDFAKRRIIPPNGKIDFTWLQWANNERLVFAASFSGMRFRTETTETRLASIRKDGEQLQWIVKPAGSDEVAGSRLSTEPAIPPQIQDDVISWLPDEPNHILVALDEDFDGKDEVRRINITNGDYTNIQRGLRGVQNWMVDANHNVVLGFGYYEAEFTLRYLSSEREWVNGTKTSWWDAGWQPIAFSTEPYVTYALGPNAQGRDVVRTMNLETGEFIADVFAAGDYDVRGIVLEDRTRRPIGARYTDDVPRVKYFDDEYDKLQRTAERAFKGMVVRLQSVSTDKRKLLVHVSSDVDPGVLYFWDRDAKSMDVYNESMPGLAPELLSQVEPVSYSARDGVEIPAYLTVPKDADKNDLPMVVMPHGGPASRSDKSFNYLAQFLASRGYAVFQPNFRGSRGYGDKFRKAGVKQWGGLMQDDVTDGARWLVESGIADPERMCIVGWSYGGYSAAMGAIKTPDLFKCAASVNGVMNLPALVNDDRKYIGGRAWVKDFGLEGEKLKTISPYHQAEKIQIPMLLIQAEDDVLVHKEQATDMHRKLNKLDKKVELVTVELGGHSMSNEAARHKTLTHIETFLDQNIGAKP